MTWKNGYYEKHGFSPQAKTKKDSAVKLLRYAITKKRTTIPPYLHLQLKLFIARYNEYYLKPFYIKIEEQYISVYRKGKIKTVLYIDFNNNEIIQMPQLKLF